MRRKPNLFIVGAPKCGTTAMYEYLKVHPQIYMSPVKEPYFFGKDIIFYTLKRPTIDEYLSLFDLANDEMYLGEASITYLYSKEAAREIYEFNPDARIIIMLRNPVEMLYSLHSQLLFTEVEDIKDFEEALNAEPLRKQMKRIPRKCTIVNFLFYREWVKYPEQIRRYLNLFGEKQVHIILYNDFRKNVRETYRKTLEFLGCDTSFGPEKFDVINPNKVIRGRWILHLLNRSLSVRLARIIFPSKTLRQKIAYAINSVLIRHVTRPPLPPKLQRELEEEFLPMIEELEKLLGRDLSAWKPQPRK